MVRQAYRNPGTKTQPTFALTVHAIGALDSSLLLYRPTTVGPRASTQIEARRAL